MDQQHAVKVAGELEAISGEPVQVAISDDPDARASIDRFAASTSPWLVAVRMVSEGVDIPRLRVLVYATNVVAPLFFRQAVGRVVRTRSGRSAPADQLAYVYLPSDPRLRQHALALEQEVSVALAEPAEDGQEQPAGGVRGEGFFAPLSSTGDLAQITEAGQTLSSTELARARQLARQVGFSEDPGDLARVARLLRLVTDSPATADADPVPQPKYERVAALRQRASAVARRIALVTGTEFSHVNQRLNEAVGVRSIAEATEQQLIERITHAKRWLDSTEAA
jgi:superfamily II DNA or RNA helicase